ncbi:hypothetical protein [Caulobacter phage Cr30]|uniref:hypothetical protein n=1 Tax=Caulobacter phage Cr30 TaxID=1357714 RepID=UPI0004A9B8F9|nr:hypothetical protein OZ74_gp282 [Caulobacter phage Cr30]AGS81061.1 hypothetical protein [Caulobacter phage Cr30]
MQNFQTIKTLLSYAKTLENFHKKYQETYLSDSHCDKKDASFGNNPNYWCFKIDTQYYAYAGYYGNSSVGSILSFYDKESVQKAFVKAMNIHQKELFQTAAKILREAGEKLKTKALDELEAAQNLLKEIENV